VQDLGSPFGVSVDQQFLDGGVVLGDRPGNGITIDEDAITGHRSTSGWAATEAPHVRSPRAGLRLVAEVSAGTVE
jgi:hypothetical protein